jgi:GTP cyclohydrolase I
MSTNPVEDLQEAALPDHAAELDGRNLPIDRVGIRGLSYPLTVWDKRCELQHTVGDFDLAVALPGDKRGTHMSRFVEVLNGYRGELSLRNIPEFLAEIQRRLEAEDVRVDVRFPYFLSRRAPVSKAESLMEYHCRFSAARVGEDVEFTLGVEVPVTTLCPCSKSISEYGAHNQRSRVAVSLRLSGMVWIEDVVEAVESCASAPLYALLKREDEKWVTEHAYDNPRFVEDLVREVVLALRVLPGVSWVRVEGENMEAIHKHEAYAVATWPQTDPEPGEQSPSKAEEHPEFGPWLSSQRRVRGESQADIARVLGLSPSLVSKVEHGEKTLSAEALSRLARHWGVGEAKLQLRAGVLTSEWLERIRQNPEGFLRWAQTR